MVNPNALQSRFTIIPQSKSGQTLVEYVLILALISVVAIASLSAMGVKVTGVFTTIDRQVAIAGNGGPAAAPPPAQGGGG